MDDVTVEYTGSATFVHLFMQMAEDEGLTVDYQPPLESRDAGTTAAVVTVLIHVGLKVGERVLDKAADKTAEEVVDRVIARWNRRGGRIAQVRKVGPRHRS